MKLLHSRTEAEQLIRSNTMALIYFGSNSCGVCQAVKPKLEKLLADYPLVATGLVDTQESIELAAAYSVFTIPVIIVFALGKEVIREARHFSVGEFEEKLIRYYDAIYGEADAELELENLREYLVREEQQPFQGWDFSYLEGRWESEPLKWDYKEIVNRYRKDSNKLLDMGTGGGEFILRLGHPYPNISVTEAWEPNLELCKERLEPLGITVKQVFEDDLLPFPAEAFDIAINRHESFDPKEVWRVLTPGGFFITQQVGAENNRDLMRKLLGDVPKPFPDHDLEHNVQLLQETGFRIVEQAEQLTGLKFFDLGAVVYFVKRLPWEFPDFSVEKYFNQLKKLAQELHQQGHILDTEHRFIIVAQKPTSPHLQKLPSWQ